MTRTRPDKTRVTCLVRDDRGDKNGWQSCPQREWAAKKPSDAGTGSEPTNDDAARLVHSGQVKFVLLHSDRFIR